MMKPGAVGDDGADQGEVAEFLGFPIERPESSVRYPFMKEYTQYHLVYMSYTVYVFIPEYKTLI